MTHSTAEVLAGAGVLGVAAAFAFFAAQGAGLTSRVDETYALSASFRSVEGISAGSDVRLAGIRVGRIVSLTLNPDTFMADAALEMQSGIVLPTDSAILISSEGLLGGNYVEIIPGGALETLGPGDEIEDTQGSVSLVSLLMKFVSASAGDSPAPGEGG